jgi:titin
MAFDSVNNLLYFVDDQRVSQGIFRIKYLPAGDSGNGSLDASSLFSLGGSPVGSVFPGGGTNCPPLGPQLFPNSAALDPEGNLWVGFGKASSIVKFSNPGAATPASFGTCQQFMQTVGTNPNNRVGTGLAWIGHDLWGATPQSVFVIPNADTVCLIGSNPACSSTNGTIQTVLPSITLTTGLIGDQIYPATNGNNLYIAVAGNIAWVGNVTGGTAGQMLTLSYTGSASSPSPLTTIGGLGLDATDPANLVLYAGDDPSGLGTAGAGRWFQITQTAAAPASPGAPLDVTASGGGAQQTAFVSWSPAQVAQPVTSYTVHNDFSSTGTTLPDVIINPLGGGLYPPTSTTIAGLNPNGAYTFQVSASNAQGSSAFSASSNIIPLGAAIPGTPTNVVATPGDAQAFVSWNAPINTNGTIITSYTVTAYVNGIPAGITASLAAPATSSVNTIISGLTNSTAYTFTVHATSAGGNGQESIPSQPITPQLSTVPVMKILVTGPVSQNPVPAIVSYQVTVTNTSLFPVTNVIVNNVLSTTDGAFIIVGDPIQGTCTPGGSGITTVACVLGNMAPGATATIDVAVQMQKAQITLTSRVTANDLNGSSTTFKQEHRTTTPPGTPPPPGAPVISIPVNIKATPTSLNPGATGTITATAQNTTGVTANSVLLTLNIDSVLTITSVSGAPGTGPNPVFCNPPAPGLVNTNVVICSISSLGGPKSPNTISLMSVSVTVIAPNQPGLQLLPGVTVSFDGIDSSNPTATAALRVH